IDVARSAGAEFDRSFARLPRRHAGDAAGGGQRAGAVLTHRHADPAKLARIELDAGQTENLIQSRTANEITDGEAVGLSSAIELVGSDQATRAGRIDDHKSRVARNMLSHMSRDSPRIAVKTTARGKSHDHLNRLSFIKVLGVQWLNRHETDREK